MAKFERVSKYPDAQLPIRKTADSAGYDFFVAEDTIVEPYENMMALLSTEYLKKTDGYIVPLELDNVAALTKETKCKPTLVPTGIKADLNRGDYLELSVRSSCPLKYWLILANGVGIIDRDYYNNPDNEGHIYFQMINLSPFPILLKKGDCIGQGIIKPYHITGEDSVKMAKRYGGFGSTDIKR